VRRRKKTHTRTTHRFECPRRCFNDPGHQHRRPLAAWLLLALAALAVVVPVRHPTAQALEER
jgi:hypothetical protein